MNTSVSDDRFDDFVLLCLSVDHDEEHWVNPLVLHKYACDLTFDPNPLNDHILLIPIIDAQAFLARPKRLGLFLDWPAGIVSFYSVSGDTKTLLYTTFTEPLNPAFGAILGSITPTSAVKLKMDTNPSSFTPEVIKESIGISYRFTFSSSGVFQCSLTGLVFNMTHEGEVMYKPLIWDNDLLESAGKVPGGLLFNIKCPQDSICQLHLPHCEPDPALVSESLSVVHITDDGMSIIQPLKITQTHVVVDITELSAFGIVWDLIKRFMTFMTKPVSSQVLLFLRPPYRSGNRILSVILLPSNVPLQEVKVQYDNCEYIQASSNCLLHKDQYYSLHSDPACYKIQPPRSQFFENYGPNYHASFEINLKITTEEVTLMVQDQEKTQVWEYTLYLTASSSCGPPKENQPKKMSTSSAEERLRSAQSRFIERVSDPVLNKLLDDLLCEKVISDAESEAARSKPRADKAQEVIDMVQKKGTAACSIMINILSGNDPYLCKQLDLV